MSIKRGLFIMAVILNVLEVFSAPENSIKPINSLPKGVSGCKRDDQLSECVQKGLQDMLKISKNGIPELNIMPVDPFVVRKATVQFENSLVQGKASVKNMKVIGLDNAVIEDSDFKINGKLTQYKGVIRLPYLKVEGSYKANIFINNNKISSSGEFNANLTDIVAKFDSTGEIYEKDGRNYIRFTSLNYEPTVGNMQLYANGLVPDENLNNALVELANENWRRAYQSLFSSTRPSWEPLIIKYFNSILEHVPWDLLLLEN